MSKTPIQELTEIINKIIPERTEKLELGCKIDVLWAENQPIERIVWGTREDMRDNGGGTVIEDNVCGEILKILGKPISITEILIALERKQDRYWYAIGSNGAIAEWDSQDQETLTYLESKLNLALPLSAPENEPAVRELIKLLK